MMDYYYFQFLKRVAVSIYAQHQFDEQRWMELTLNENEIKFSLKQSEHEPTVIFEGCISRQMMSEGDGMEVLRQLGLALKDGKFLADCKKHKIFKYLRTYDDCIAEEIKNVMPLFNCCSWDELIERCKVYKQREEERKAK